MIKLSQSGAFQNAKFQKFSSTMVKKSESENDKVESIRCISEGDSNTENPSYKVGHLVCPSFSSPIWFFLYLPFLDEI